MTLEVDFEEIVVCLFDGEYHLGVAALTNSLVKFQFRGLINVGYKGVLPLWVNQLEYIDDNYFYVTKDIVIHFKEVETNMFLGYFKPFFVKDTFNTYTSAKKIFFFDADITVHAPWGLFSKWLEKGACLCLDSAFHFLHHNHPWRKDWRKLASADEKLLNNTNHYFNSGFVGIEKESAVLIDRWINITEKYIKNGGEINCFLKDSSNSYKGDQDLLNAAITTSSDIEISVMGKEAMGFTLPATIMMHAIDDRKPWNKGFLKQLLKYGIRPNMADKAFLSFCKYPIRIFSDGKYRLKKLDLFGASVLGRFLG